jgi:prepilin-type N-terminal cleavage/methylation domain-containing protein
MVKKSGFSLIELIIVIGLLSLLMLAISSTMLMSIVSSNRIRTATKVKQAGNYALGQIQTMIRSAKTISSCTPNLPSPSLTVINPDGGDTTIFAELDGDGTTRIASNSGTYLTPDNLETSSFSITCEPSQVEPTLIKVSFDLQGKLATERPSSNPILHFETSVNLRNE